MPIAVIVLALAAYLYVLFAVPAFRWPGAGLLVLLGAALGAYLALSEAEGERATTRLQPQDLTLSELQLMPTQRGQTLRGRVTNRSAQFRLRDFTVVLNLYDCPSAEAEDAECDIVAEGTGIARADVPPGQVRAFSIPFTLAGMPEITGELRWSHRISAVRAAD